VTAAPPPTLVSPPDPAAWDALVEADPEASAFQPSAWARLWTSEWPRARWEALVLGDAAGGYAAGLAMITRDEPLGRRVMAMPYATYGGPIVRGDHPDPVAARRALLAAYAAQVRSGVMLAELSWLRGHRRELPDDLPVSEGFTQVRAIASDWPAIFRDLPHSVRSRVRQAEEQGVEFRPVADLDGVRAYHRLAVGTMRRLGGTPKPLSIYRRVLEQLVPAGLARFDLAVHQGRSIGGSLHVLHRGTALNWLTVSDEAQVKLRPNHLLIARVLQALCESGFTEYNFGGSPAGAEGLIQFKESWGTVRAPVLEVRKRSLIHRLLKR
jgi:CelD/BcsL family acetyltransferase involved in cellulose biosynthesis